MSALGTAEVQGQHCLTAAFEDEADRKTLLSYVRINYRVRPEVDIPKHKKTPH
jgi:hypothetical protein